MKKLYAISSNGKTLKSYFDIRFGKCECVVIYDPIKKDHAVLENPFKTDIEPGIKLAEFLEKYGVTSVITGDMDPATQDHLVQRKISHILPSVDNIKIEDLLSTITISK
jgi:predicted Fe-Mo cluster-binding NifX family protein